GHRPVGRGVHVAHVDRERDQWTNAAVRRERREEPDNHRLLVILPRKADAHIDRLHVVARRFVEDENRAVEPAREENSRRHIISLSCIPSPNASTSATATGCSTTTASANIPTATTRRPKSKYAPQRSHTATWSAISATSSGWGRAGSIASSITRCCCATTIRWSRR